MASDPATPPHPGASTPGTPTSPASRRVVLTGMLGAAVATLAAALGRPGRVDAADPNDVLLGGPNAATTTTGISNVTTGADVLSVSTTGTGSALVASSTSGLGVLATSGATVVAAIRGWSTGTGDRTGVMGASGLDADEVAAPAKTGVFGYAAQAADAIGVRGESTAGVGVRGIATTGSGVVASSSSGKGVLATSGSDVAVYGYSGSGIGVQGDSDGSFGVRGYSGPSVGGYFTSGSDRAVFAHSSSLAAPALVAQSAGGVTGILGYSGGGAAPEPAPFATGVFGYSAIDATAAGVRGGSADGAGVVGTSGTRTGVLGYSGTGATPAYRAKTAIYGQADQGTTGIAVRGHSAAGTGMYASSTTGTALRAVGRVRFDDCVGAAVVLAGTRSVVVTPGIDLTSSSIVTATLMGAAGGTTTVHRVAVNATADTFTIHLTADATANVKVGWHVFG